MGEGVDGVAGEPRHAFGEDQIDFSGKGVGDHSFEAFAVFGRGAGDAFVDEHPPRYSLSQGWSESDGSSTTLGRQSTTTGVRGR